MSAQICSTNYAIAPANAHNNCLEYNEAQTTVFLHQPPPNYLIL